MGLCISVLGLPLFEDAECRAKRQAANLRKKELKLSEREDRLEDRQAGRDTRAEIRNADGSTPFEAVVEDLTVGVSSQAAAAVGAVFGQPAAAAVERVAGPNADALFIGGAVLLLGGGVIFLQRSE